MRHTTSLRARGCFRATTLILSCLLLLAACKGGPSEASAKGDGEKGPEAVPVEVATAQQRPMAASYTGTAPLEAP
ncbi:MAG TPA: efflux transporter periplasmic adaptor subunit, partial [Lysobacter sp.]|nr:efflux transporter periplasmic adaptor subunit [Lysobacter sp.]